MKYSTAKKTALAAAVGFALSGAGSANAVDIGFAPGGTGGADANAMPVGVLADLNTARTVSTFIWKSVNNTLPAPTAAGFLDNRQWFISCDTGADGICNAGDTFTESFSFHLMTVTPASGGDTYGVDTAAATIGGTAGVVVPTHVFMTASLSGTVNGALPIPSAGAGQLGNLDLTYTHALFEMFFDEDGNPNDAAGQEKIAVFGSVDSAQQGVADGSTDTGIATLQWIVNFDAALKTRFFEADLTTDLASGPDVSGTFGAGFFRVSDPLNPTLFKVTTQAVNWADDPEIGCVNQTISNTSAVACAGPLPANNILGIRVQGQGSATGESFIQVPEPASLALMGAGLLGLGAASRRRRKKQG